MIAIATLCLKELSGDPMLIGIPMIQSQYDLPKLSCLAERVNHNLNRTIPGSKNERNL